MRTVGVKGYIMGFYSDSVVIKGLAELDAFFSGKLPNYDKNIIINEDDSDMLLFNNALTSSWRAFFSLQEMMLIN